MPIQFRQHLECNSNMDTYICRQYHSTETAMVRIQGDLLRFVDRKKGVVVGPLHMSAAFDIVNNSTLISQLRSVGIHGTVLQWLESYMLNRTQEVYNDNHNSRRTLIEYGIPKHSVLGTILFSIYTLPLGPSSET